MGVISMKKTISTIALMCLLLCSISAVNTYAIKKTKTKSTQQKDKKLRKIKQLKNEKNFEETLDLENKPARRFTLEDAALKACNFMGVFFIPIVTGLIFIAMSQ